MEVKAVIRVVHTEVMRATPVIKRVLAVAMKVNVARQTL